MTDFEIENGVLMKYNGDSIQAVIPHGVRVIGDRAFADCAFLRTVTVPDGVTEIGNYAFYNCSALKGITLPNGVTKIGDGAFYGCSAFTDITLPDSVTLMGERLLEGCTSLRSYVLPSSLLGSPITVGGFRIRSGVLKSYIGKAEYEVVPSNVTDIGEGAFSECATLREILLPEQLTSIGRGAFSNMPRIENINIGFVFIRNLEGRDSINAWKAAIRGFLIRYFRGEISETEAAEWRRYIGRRTSKLLRELYGEPMIYRYLTENKVISPRRVAELLEETENVECRSMLLAYFSRIRAKGRKSCGDIIEELLGLDDLH